MALYQGHMIDPQSNGRHYRTDGQGRDSYIYGDNGGFSMMNKPSYQAPKGSMNTGGIQGNYQLASPPHKPGSIQHYKQDGSGRDSYIINSQGGFMLPTVYGNPRTFATELRGYERSPKKLFGRFSPTEGNPERYNELGAKTFASGKEKSVFEQGKIPYPKEEKDHFQNGQNLLTDKKAIVDKIMLQIQQEDLSSTLSIPKRKSPRMIDIRIQEQEEQFSGAQFHTIHEQPKKFRNARIKAARTDSVLRDTGLRSTKNANQRAGGLTFNPSFNQFENQLDGKKGQPDDKQSRISMKSTQNSTTRFRKQSQVDMSSKYENFKQSHINGYIDFQQENKPKIDQIKSIVSKAKSSKRNYQAELFQSAYAQSFNQQSNKNRDVNFDKGRNTRNPLISNEPQDHSTFNSLINAHSAASPTVGRRGIVQPQLTGAL